MSLDVLHDDPSWRSRGWPLEAECDFRRRLGELYKGEDHWWSVRPTFGLWALVELARKIGHPAQVEIAEAELRRWQAGDRGVW